jgi:hypothetical protein
MEAKDFNPGDHVYTRNIQAAADLLAIGCPMRDPMGLTVTETADHRRDVIFWLENRKIVCGGIELATADWLKALLVPWAEFKLSLEHPIAMMKAAGENRQVLVRAVKAASDHPFRVIQRGNRVVVIGPAVSEENARRLMSQG